jgi:hypothetical protein
MSTPNQPVEGTSTSSTPGASPALPTTPTAANPQTGSAAAETIAASGSVSSMGQLQTQICNQSQQFQQTMKAQMDEDINSSN